MQTRIRHIARRRKGIVTESEKLFDKQTISIGRATDQDIFLTDPGVSYNHARLSILPDGGISVTSISRIGFYNAGQFVQNCMIRRSGEILFGTHNIKINLDEKNALVDITIEKMAEDIVQAQSEKMLPTRLEQTWLSRRRMSWIGFLLVLALALGLPMLGYFDQQANEVMKAYKVPGDEVWLSGTISSPHQHFASDCKQCHQKPFEKVQGKACIACHGDTRLHADPDNFALPELQTSRCTICHKEHSGSENLIQTRQNLCTACHESLSGMVETDLKDIADFSKNHPQFRASLMPHGSMRDDESAWKRISLDDPALRHETGLVFPHDLHLDKEGVKGPRGLEKLQCSSCHQSDASENYMQPINMEKHCQSCHRLEFDPDDLERELPHSDLKNLRKMLNEYYSLSALRGNYSDANEQRRRPGKPLTRREQEVALQWALQKAEQVAVEVVEFRSCNLCHTVERDPGSDLGWRIPEVNTSQKRWLPKAAFTHEKHKNTACVDCHAADQSSQSEQVLLPKVAVCQQCHGGQQTKNRLQSGCIDCHKFHQPGQLLMQSKFHELNN